MAEALLQIAGVRRPRPRGSPRPVAYCVAYEHQPFVRMLMTLDFKLGAVREHHGDRLFLAVVCSGTRQAKQRTMKIMEALIARPEVLDLSLGDWRARRVDSRLLLYWTAIEVETVPLH